jgi:dTDP-4-dehydrorhamnose 3,5-epimerase-like enzyme
MNKINVFECGNGPLEVHTDQRGTIADVFVKANLEHVSIIHSVKGAIRGNHYHLESTQSILITKGELEYWYRSSAPEARVKMIRCVVGDLVTSDPGEIHTMRTISESSEFIAFTQGKRGGSDYEADTFRVPNIIQDNENPSPRS